MKKRRVRCFAVALAAVVSACFESAEPLITGAEADFPFAPSVRYSFYEWDKQRRVWQPHETGTLKRDGDRYLQLDDGGRLDGSNGIRFKAIGDGYFVVQQQNAAAYVYDLLRIQNNIVYQFGFACTESDRKFVERGLLDGFAATERSGNTCKVSSLDKLRQIFLANAAEQNQPYGMYTIDR
jgi:hypothetical protein